MGDFTVELLGTIVEEGGIDGVGGASEVGGAGGSVVETGLAVDFGFVSESRKTDNSAAVMTGARKEEVCGLGFVVVAEGVGVGVALVVIVVVVVVVGIITMGEARALICSTRRS